MKKYLLIALLTAPPWVMGEETSAGGVAASEVAPSVAEVAKTSEEKAQALYEEGIALARRGDFMGGVELLKQAGQLGHIEAQLLASSMLIDGTFYEQGLALLDEAVATGSPRARLELAKLLLAEDPEIERPVQEGQALLEALVDEEYPPALFVRASLAEKGNLYEKDEVLALRLFHRAAELGDALAMQRLYWIYRQGELGQAADPAQAQAWKQKREDALSKADS